MWKLSKIFAEYNRKSLEDAARKLVYSDWIQVIPSSPGKLLDNP